MSQRYRDIVEIVRTVLGHRREIADLPSAVRVRRDATRRIAAARCVSETTVTNSFRRGLEPDIRGTAQFDQLLCSLVLSDDNTLSAALCNHVSDAEDRELLAQLPIWTKTDNDEFGGIRGTDEKESCVAVRDELPAGAQSAEAWQAIQELYREGVWLYGRFVDWVVANGTQCDFPGALSRDFHEQLGQLSRFCTQRISTSELVWGDGTKIVEEADRMIRDTANRLEPFSLDLDGLYFSFLLFWSSLPLETMQHGDLQDDQNGEVVVAEAVADISATYWSAYMTAAEVCRTSQDVHDLVHLPLAKKLDDKNCHGIWPELLLAIARKDGHGFWGYKAILALADHTMAEVPASEDLLRQARTGLCPEDLVYLWQKTSLAGCRTSFGEVPTDAC